VRGPFLSVVTRMWKRVREILRGGGGGGDGVVEVPRPAPPAGDVRRDIVLDLLVLWCLPCACSGVPVGQTTFVSFRGPPTHRGGGHSLVVLDGRTLPVLLLEPAELERRAAVARERARAVAAARGSGRLAAGGPGERGVAGAGAGHVPCAAAAG
jgi:hypothetical protein